eukprot:SAG31_NODE_32297_length_357_cov_1.062016_1_plen_51_part_01
MNLTFETEQAIKYKARAWYRGTKFSSRRGRLAVPERTTVLRYLARYSVLRV